jgi:hypothetical protein
MSDMSVSQARQARAQAERQISEILSRLAKETGLRVQAVTVAASAAAARKPGEGDAIGTAIAEAMKLHVNASIQLEAP